jgi:pyruvate dehydrogenase E1 component alpha subunit
MKDNLIKNVPKTELVKMYTLMLRIRKFEEKIVELLENEEIKCPVHLYIGQEAIASGVCTNLNKNDYVFSTHRSHGHYIAKGGDLNKLMAELFCRKDGCSKGKGGSMHVIDKKVGFLGSSAIVAGSIPLAVGSALSSFIQGKNKVGVAFFGDGATDEGVFYECVNFASIMKLPMVFICENNLFSTHMPISLRQPSNNIFQRIIAYKIPSIQIDGNDVLNVYRASKQAILKARKGEGPSFIECMTFRWRSHVGHWLDIDIGYRKKALVEKWIKKCPIKKFENILVNNGILSVSKKNEIQKIIDKEIEKALTFAKSSPSSYEEELLQDIYYNKKRNTYEKN